MILGFTIYAWITIATVLVTFGILLFTRLRSDLVFLGVIGVLFVTGVLNANEALSGFSSTTVAMVGVKTSSSTVLTWNTSHQPVCVSSLAFFRMQRIRTDISISRVSTTTSATFSKSRVSATSSSSYLDQCNSRLPMSSWNVMI